MTNLDDTQQSALDRFTAVYAEYSKEEAALNARIDALRKVETARIAALLARSARAARDAVDAGVPVRKIAQLGMGQKATMGAYRLLTGGAMLAGATATLEAMQPAIDEEFVATGTGVRVTPPRGLLTPLLASWGQTEEALNWHPELCSAVFRADASPVTEGFNPKLGRHPVVAYVLGSPAYQAKIRAAAA